MSANLPSIPDAPAPCIRSIKTGGSAPDLFRVWWAARSDSSAVLSVQHSGNQGKTWEAPMNVESRDRARRGCDRPAPAIFYDRPSGYLHVVYFIQATDGAGVYFTHSMDKGAMFHTPVPVVYGNAPSRASVTGIADTVVVVFEDPNATTPRIGIALSRSAGHIFEQRGQVTPEDVRAVAPWVALDQRKITVWWKEGSNAAGIAGDQVGSRVGVWR
jgi:hypothetical protein